MRNAHAIITVLVLLSAAGLCPSAVAAGDAAAGKTVFGTKCKTCHGAEGQGNPGLAKMLKAEIRDLGSPEVQKRSDDEIKKIITAGNGKMKPVAGVAGTDLDNVVAFVRSLKKK